MSVCPNCGRDLPEGGLYCPDCGATAVDLSVAQPDLSTSYFNSGITATSQPQVTEPAAPAQDSGFVPPSPSPEEKRSSSTGKRGLMIAIIAILAVLLVGTAFESGMLGSVA